MTDRERIQIDRTREMRTMDISKMISEGGLGADNYYHIVKDRTTEENGNVDGNNEKQIN